MTESLIHGSTMPREFASTMTVEFFALFPCLDEEEQRLRYDKDDDEKTESYHKAVFLEVFRDHKNTSYKFSAY